MKKMNLVLAALVAALFLNLNPHSAFGQEGDDEETTEQMLAVLRIAFGDLTMEYDAIDAELASVKAARDRLATQIAQATTNGDNAEATRLRADLDTATTEKSRLVAELARLESENSELRVKISELERANTALVAENGGLRERVDGLQQSQQVASVPSIAPAAGSIWNTPPASSQYTSSAMPAAYNVPAVDPSAPYRTAYVGWHPEFVSPYSDVRWEDDEGCREVRNNGWTGTAAVRVAGISMFQHSPESGGYISSREAVQEPNVPIYFCSATSEPMVTITLLRETSTGSAMWTGSRWASYTRARNPCSARFTTINPVFSYGHMAGWCSESNF